MGQCDQKYSRGRGEERVKLSSRTATFSVLTPYNVAPQYRNVPHPTLPANTLHMQ